MPRPIATRSQRRMERKQALILLILVLAVSLVSFALGVVVGRGGAQPPANPVSPPAAAVKPPDRLPIARQQPATEAPATSAAPDAPAAQPAQPAEAETLTFYDTLPRGEQPPLGSGINLPPEQSTAAKSSESPASAAPKPGVAKPAAKPPAQPTSPAPGPAATGPYLVQVASFREAPPADKLLKRLKQRDYPAFVEVAELGDKGRWHRVYAGRYPDAASAEQVIKRLKSEDKLSPILRKR